MDGQLLGVDDLLFDNATNSATMDEIKVLLLDNATSSASVDKINIFDSSNHSKPSSPAAGRTTFDDDQFPTLNETAPQSTATDLTSESE